MRSVRISFLFVSNLGRITKNGIRMTRSHLVYVRPSIIGTDSVIDNQFILLINANLVKVTF